MTNEDVQGRESKKLPCWRNEIGVVWAEAGRPRRISITDGSIIENEAVSALLGPGFEHLGQTHAPRRIGAVSLDALRALGTDPHCPAVIASRLKSLVLALGTNDRSGAGAGVSIGLPLQVGERPDSLMSDRESLALRFERLIDGRWVRGAIQLTFGSLVENRAIVATLGDARFDHLARVAFARRFMRVDPAQVAAGCRSEVTSWKTSDPATRAMRELLESCRQLDNQSYRNVEIGPFSHLAS